MKTLIRILSVIVTGYLLTACQMSPVRQFSKVQVGMEKDQVLAVMGSPQKTLRRASQDRWTYVFYDDDNKKVQREVRFEAGFAVHVGEPLTPEISAEEQDAKNEALNQAQEQIALENKRKSLSAPEDLEEAVKGRNEIRYVPVFTPVQ